MAFLTSVACPWPCKALDIWDCRCVIVSNRQDAWGFEHRFVSFCSTAQPKMQRTITENNTTPHQTQSHHTTQLNATQKSTTHAAQRHQIR
mmetsp:Transcript_36499/g.61018  ORF Transcript_36499/g.61018 Transcript_36499/m.61018 type:complete len:90 (-) Transcript_36499:804-1073(-)